MIGILSVLSTSQLAVALVNWLATVLVTPRSPAWISRDSAGIARSGGGPDHTTSAKNIEDLVEALRKSDSWQIGTRISISRC
jgi:hypothetical protein